MEKEEEKRKGFEIKSTTTFFSLIKAFEKLKIGEVLTIRYFDEKKQKEIKLVKANL